MRTVVAKGRRPSVHELCFVRDGPVVVCVLEASGAAGRLLAGTDAEAKPSRAAVVSMLAVGEAGPSASRSGLALASALRLEAKLCIHFCRQARGMVV